MTRFELEAVLADKQKENCHLNRQVVQMMMKQTRRTVKEAAEASVRYVAKLQKR
jgi:hypothetical protein